MRSIFFISPVRIWDELPEGEQLDITRYVERLRGRGYRVHWPKNDTKQDGDPIGARICRDNRDAIWNADEIHIWWHASSEGSRFDIGIWFGMQLLINKPFVLANPEGLETTKKKSFRNAVLYWSGNLTYADVGLEDEARQWAL